MRAALVSAFDRPPSFGSFAPPTASASDALIRVTAVAVPVVVRLQASGGLYTPGGALPFVPGLDGVGHLEGAPSQRVYFAFPAAPHGALAELVAVPKASVVPLPDALTDVEAAALVNPGNSSWIALTRRTRLKQGETVLVNGATGVSGRLAVQIAKHLGAGRVIATGRNAAALEETRALGADEVILLDGSKDDMVGRFKAVMHGSGGVDVVLDYLWGPSAEQIILACINAGSRTEKARKIRYVQIGNIAGPLVSMSAVPFRSSGLELLGSGLGSEPTSEVMASAAEMFAAAKQAKLAVDTWTAPIEDVEKAWTDTSKKDKRLVITV